MIRDTKNIKVSFGNYKSQLLGPRNDVDHRVFVLEIRVHVTRGDNFDAGKFAAHAHTPEGIF